MGNTELHIAATHESCTAEDFLHLIKLGNIDSKNNDGNTAVHLSTESGSDSFLQFLLSKGAKPDIPNNSGLLPIWFAQGNTHITSMLVRYGSPNPVSSVIEVEVHPLETDQEGLQKTSKL